MHMIKTILTDKMKTAMRAHDALTLETLRYVLSTLKYVEIEKQRPLTEEEEIQALSSEVKKRNDAIKLFTDSGRMEVVEEEKKKLAVIKELLPAEMTEVEVTAIIDETLAGLEDKSIGSVMRALMPKVRGKADGNMVNRIVKEKLGN